MVSIPVGTIINRERIAIDPTVLPQKAATTLLAGVLVYLKGATGIEVVTAALPADVSNIFFSPTASDNSSGILGDKKLELWPYKCGARVVGRAKGAIPVNSHVTIAADGEMAVLDITTTTTDSFLHEDVGVYRGHVDELYGKNTPYPTDAADNEIDIVVDLV